MSFGRTMAVPDAHLLWLSAKVPNDQFLLYVFEGSPSSSAIEDIRRRAEASDELRLRVRDEDPLRYPRWVRAEVSSEQFVLHDGSVLHEGSVLHDGIVVRDWQDCLTTVGRLVADQLDVTEMAWRVHVLPSGRHCAVVVQVAHALGDGTRSATLAAALLGRRAPIPPVAEPDRGSLLGRSVAAARAHLRLLRDTEAGVLPPAGAPRSPLSINGRPGNSSPGDSPVVRVITVARDQLPGATVTVGALVAIAEALGGYLADRGEDVSNLGAEVPMALDHNAAAGHHRAAAGRPVQAHNNFRNVSVGLHPRVSCAERGERIAAELAAHRLRGQHPGIQASAAAFAAVPAPVLRWGVRQFDPSARPAAVAGHTVVSSVNRGPADLSFGGRPVVLTAGFPALSPMMSLTHGVHGIGDTVAVSVHADPGNVEIDEYLDRLTRALLHPC